MVEKRDTLCLTVNKKLGNLYYFVEDKVLVLYTISKFLRFRTSKFEERAELFLYLVLSSYVKVDKIKDSKIPR